MKKPTIISLAVLLTCGCSASPKAETPVASTGTGETVPTEEPTAEPLTYKTVGDDEYGYIQIPSDWGRFEDVNGASAQQWSDQTGTYIVSLDYFPADGYDAETYAAGYLEQVAADESVDDYHSAKVTVGEYEAYQVYMYYPEDAIFLVTYWFETEDEMIRYLALEGGSDLVDYLSIADSFSLVAE